MDHQMHLTDLVFGLIQKGKKIIEVRLLDEKRRLLNIGDEIIFENRSDENEKIQVVVKDLIIADSFENLFKKINLVDGGWDLNATPESAASDMKKYYNDQEIRENGVLAIKFKIKDWLKIMQLSERAKNLELGIYEHYKGNKYKVIGVVNHSETTEELVLYQALYGEYGLWVRPLKMFLENVEINGEMIPRFKFIK